MLIHAPFNGGFNSRERAYHGFNLPTGRYDYQLRAAEPLLLTLHKDDLISICNVEGASTAWLVPIDESGLIHLDALGIPSSDKQFSPTLQSVCDLHPHSTYETRDVGGGREILQPCCLHQ